MSKINIKIVEVSQDTHTVVLKYASSNSKKAIDEYPAVAFQTTNYLVNSLEEFIEAVRPELSLYVQQRDMAESPENPVDMTGWLDQEIQIDSVELPTLQPQPIEGLADPEVKL